MKKREKVKIIVQITEAWDFKSGFSIYCTKYEYVCASVYLYKSSCFNFSFNVASYHTIFISQCFISLSLLGWVLSWLLNLCPASLVTVLSMCFWQVLLIVCFYRHTFKLQTLFPAAQFLKLLCFTHQSHVGSKRCCSNIHVPLLVLQQLGTVFAIHCVLGKC